MEPLTADDAEQLLEGLPLVPAMAGSIAEMKNLRDRCLAAGIPDRKSTRLNSSH